MESAGEKTSGTYTYQELMDRVCRCLAGRAAEIEVYGDIAGNNTGASSDIRQARYFMKSSLNDYAEPADEKQIWDVYAGNARVQR